MKLDANRSSRTASSRRSMEILRDEASQRGVAVNTRAWHLICLRLWGDPVQIQQVLVNLVGNAFDALAAAQTTESDSGYRNRKAAVTAVLSSA